MDLSTRFSSTRDSAGLDSPPHAISTSDGVVAALASSLRAGARNLNVRRRRFQRRLLSTLAFSAACLLFGLTGFLAAALALSRSPQSLTAAAPIPRARSPSQSRGTAAQGMAPQRAPRSSRPRSPLDRATGQDLAGLLEFGLSMYFVASSLLLLS